MRARGLGMLAVAVLALPRVADAQCGAQGTTCSGCHDGAHVVLGDERWHEDHAFADLCVACHGGRGDAERSEDAHDGLVAPLADVPSRCGSCHGANAHTLASRYRRSPLGEGGAGVTIDPRAHDPRPPPASLRAHGEPGPNAVLSIVVAAVGLSAAAFIARDRRLGRRVLRHDSRAP